MITIKNLDFGYKKTKLFKDLSLDLKHGSIYGLLGKNGAGKTTFLKILAGLIFPESGEISVLGFTPSERNPDFLKEIFFLPEEYTLPGIKPGEFKKIYAPFYPDFDDEEFFKLISEFDLPEDSKLSALSYGQKKKFLLSFGIASNSRILLLDEPTNGLDIPTKTRFRKIVASSQSKERIIIISTHQVRDVENLIDPVIILDDGSIIFNETMDRVTDVLSVKKISTLSDETDILYSENEIDGYKVVVKNRESDQNVIDFEILFNTVITNPQGIQAAFNGGYHNENK